MVNTTITYFKFYVFNIFTLLFLLWRQRVLFVNIWSKSQINQLINIVKKNHHVGTIVSTKMQHRTVSCISFSHYLDYFLFKCQGSLQPHYPLSQWSCESLSLALIKIKWVTCLKPMTNAHRVEISQSVCVLLYMWVTLRKWSLNRWVMENGSETANSFNKLFPHSTKET